MIYSVWNQGAWKYDYFQSTSVQDTANAPAPAHAARFKATDVGLAPDQLCWPVPADATHVGSGEVPRGRIGRRGPALAGGGLTGHVGGGAGGSDGLGSYEVAGVPVVGIVIAVGILYWAVRS